jgi:hypothetical protein
MTAAAHVAQPRTQQSANKFNSSVIVEDEVILFILFV